MIEPKSKISATLIFSDDRKIQSINLNAETDGDAATLASALNSILKRPENELDEIAIRMKWLTAMIQVAELEAKLARLEHKDDLT